MKKIIAMLLILLLIPVCVPAEEDPAVGTWYFYMTYDNAPNSKDFADYLCTVYHLFVLPSGDLAQFELDIKKDSSTESNAYDIVGKWERTGSGEYKFSLLGVGEYPAYLKGEDLHVCLYEGVYYILHKMAPINWYKDLYRK